MKSKSLKVFLTGGLGNQLFQLGAVIHYANSRRIELDVVTASPRKHKDGDAEILTLNIPQDIEVLKEDQGAFVRKVFGFNLRSGYLPKNYERSGSFRILRAFSSSLALGMKFKKFYRVNVSNDLGNDIQFNFTDRDEVIIGYFQTYQVAVEIQKRKIQLFSQICEDEYLKYKSLADREKPLLVHVRLGDYKSEDSFGILSSDYYKDAIEHAWRSESFKKIWLFSDEPEQAIQRIPHEFRSQTRIMESQQLGSAETLRIMSVCRGYVIANSSFSWWAAYLSECENAIVVAPSPWFTGLPEPTDLIPSNWVRVAWLKNRN
jgi:hypothetical protein